MKANCVAGNVIPPEEIGLTFSHKTFVVYTYFGNIPDNIQIFQIIRTLRSII